MSYDSLPLDLNTQVDNKLVKNGEKDQAFVLQLIRVNVDQVG